MRTIIYILIFWGIVANSCTPDNYEIKKFDFEKSQIKYLKVYTNSHILYADGESELTLNYKAYDIVTRELKRRKITEDNDTIVEVYSQTDTFELAQTRIPAGTIKFFKEDGEEILNGIYKTDSGEADSFSIVAKAGSIESEDLSVDVRIPFTVKEKVVVPVIFHIIDSKGIKTPEISTEVLQSKLDRLNIVFGRQKVKASNGGNANIEFKLAEYSIDGEMLEEKGIHRVKTTKKGSDVKPVIVSNTWDVGKYLNVWVCTHNDRVSLPKTMVTSHTDTLPGLEISEGVNTAEEVDLSNPENVGIIIGARYKSWNKVYEWNFYKYDFLTKFGTFFGLLSTRTPDSEIDSDFCSDTYAYTNLGYTTLNSLKSSIDGYRYGSENIMDMSSPQYMISGEQVERMRWVLENCPSRWFYKSDFAFTGN